MPIGNVCVCVGVPFVDSTLRVQQGCPMSPTLFGLYIDQSEFHLSSRAEKPPPAQGQVVPTLLYADDIMLS